MMQCYVSHINEMFKRMISKIGIIYTCTIVHKSESVIESLLFHGKQGRHFIGSPHAFQKLY